MADPNFVWQGLQPMPSRSFNCGYCGNLVSSVVGFPYKYPGAGVTRTTIYICPHCAEPTYFGLIKQWPGVRPGATVTNLPKDVQTAYDEARDCVAASAYTAAAMLARKLLMHLAVGCGAAQGLNFKAYVEHLVNRGYVPPQGKTWVDHIRNKGNEFNHELTFATQQDAQDLIGFLEMLLKFNYEFPAKVGGGKAATVTGAIPAAAPAR